MGIAHYENAARPMITKCINTIHQQVCNFNLAQGAQNLLAKVEM